jgi:putative tryptophan/tyrosine transport system substrate-binding protein
VKRREFITLLGGTAAWPLVARAQPTMPVIGYLDPTSPGDFAEPHHGFLQGLKETGYVEGENVAISYRFAENRTDRLPELANELVRRRVAVIFTFASGVFAAKAATATIPIAFVLADDPVRLGLVTNIARPGGNLTGINFLNAELGAKRLDLLRQLVPTATRFVLLGTQTGAFADAALENTETAARAAGLRIRLAKVSTSQEIDAAFGAFARDRPDALFVSPDPFFRSRRVQLTHLATRHAIPATYALRDYCDVGGLMSYGTSLADAHRQPASMRDASSKARSLRTCPSCRRASSSWSSTRKPPGYSVSPCRPRCSPSPTK